MNYSCPNCGGTAMFDPESGKMKCTQCGSLVTSAFSIKMDETMIPKEEQKKQPSAISGEERARRYKEKIEKGSGDIGIGYYYDEDIETGDQSENASKEEDLPEEAYMEINVYRCTSCGAELMINDKEASTFCAFCGQPTIVFDRVSRELQPNYIIPFAISEEEAVEKIRDKFVKGTFVPNRVKNPEVDKVRGIYVPFWLFTSHIRMQANLVGEIRKERYSSHDRYGNPKYSSNEYVEAVSYYRDAECTFERVTVDASRKLNDQMSQRLEPYNLKALKPFDSQYLSGFYADKYDVDVQDVGVIAHNRVKELMKEGLKDSCDGTSLEVIQSKDTYEVESIEYALLPAWFMTFRYEDELYTVLVNGQTGKVIGNVPIDKKIATGWFIGAVVFSCLIISPLVAFLAIGAFTARRAGNIIVLLISIVSACVGTFVKGIVRWRHYKRDHARFKSQMTLQYVKKRQDKTWIR